MRCTEEGHKHFIEHSVFGADEVSKNNSASLALSKRCSLNGTKVAVGDADGLGTTDADDADGSTLSCSDSTDGIVSMRCHEYSRFYRNHTNLHKKNDKRWFLSAERDIFCIFVGIIRTNFTWMKKTIALFIFSLAVATSLFGQTNDHVAYINQYKDIAIAQMRKYHIPASITLAQGLLESGAGKSQLALEANNHFGIKCHSWDGKRTYHDDDEADECFRVYQSVSDSYEDHSMFLATSSRYAFLFKFAETDYVNWARGLKRAGYATSPTYADKLIEIIERYDLDRFDREQSGSSRYLGPHTPYIANDIVYIVARQGDTMQAIAEEFGISKRKLISYNDLYKGYVPVKGDIIYLARKHRKAKKPYEHHIVGDGESMYMISQKYAVRLNRLYKMNKATPDTYAPMIGDVIRLR